MRQRTGPKPRISVPTLAWDYKPDFHIPEHSHNAGQSIYAPPARWKSSRPDLLVHPAQLSVWIPARVSHRILMKGAVSGLHE
jgi:hypothetical protein